MTTKIQFTKDAKAGRRERKCKECGTRLLSDEHRRCSECEAFRDQERRSP